MKAFLPGIENIKMSTSVTSAAIGYETRIINVFVVSFTNIKMEKPGIEEFDNYPQKYTVIDVRNRAGVKVHPVFKKSLNIPLLELRANIGIIPLKKPVVVHGASGFRSAAGSSIIQSVLENKARVFDLGEEVKSFLPAEVDHLEF